ncbi:hypothetical protein ACFQY0_03025 [Haloferula chungangensis]|uniref:AAA family ATPase n=1 Tax=Haloferula chungangensis TaxID=1048331 RepID=A0ABW2L1F6_9BACT
MSDEDVSTAVSEPGEGMVNIGTAADPYFVQAVKVVAFEPTQEQVEAKQNAEAETLTKDDFRRMLGERVFDHTTVPPRPIPILKLGKHVISTPGNLTNIQAPAKAGKSAVIGAIIAAIMDGNRSDADTLGFSAENEKGYGVIHFDTEQSRFDHDQLIRRAVNRVGANMVPPWFRSYCVTDIPQESRLHCLEIALADAKETFGGVFAIIIDGIADLVRDPNSPEESFAFVDMLHRDSIRYDCATITVLHENPGSGDAGKMRGHLGSQLERKAETPLRLAKDATTGITTVWTDRARHCHLPKTAGLCFQWSDEAGMHVSAGSAGEIKANQRQEKFREEVERAFDGGESLSYSEFVARIMERVGIAKKTAEKRITTYQVEGAAVKSPSGSYSLVPRLPSNPRPTLNSPSGG